MANRTVYFAKSFWTVALFSLKVVVDGPSVGHIHHSEQYGSLLPFFIVRHFGNMALYSMIDDHALSISFDSQLEN